MLSLLDADCAVSLCRGLEAVMGCSRIYLEAYTSILLIEKEKLVSGMSVLVSYSEPVK